MDLGKKCEIILEQNAGSRELISLIALATTFHAVFAINV